jgi:hypothetical protein
MGTTALGMRKGSGEPIFAGMRALIAILALAAATPAAAQTSSQLADLQMQQQLAQQRAVAQHNELFALEARVRTEQAILDLQLQRALPARAPELPYPVAAPTGRVDTSKLPSIPDAALAASNRRVQDAAKNRR